MKAIILAAGRGSRMGEKTKVLPKCLAKFRGKTLLEHQLEAIRRANIAEIGVITGYHAEEIRNRQPNLTYFHNEDWENTNMVATMLKAKDWLENDDCVISYADIVYESSAVTTLAGVQSDISLIYYTKFLELWQKRFDNPLDDLETFKLDAEGNLKEIGKKPQTLEEIEGQYMGLLKFTPKGWAEIARHLKGDLPKPVEKIDMTGLLSHLLTKNVKIRAVAYDGLWLEVDSERDLEIYEKNL